MRIAAQKYKKRQIFEGYTFMLPWLIGFLVFTVYPLLASIYYSFTSYNLVGNPPYVGLKNYFLIFLEDPDFYPCLLRTLRYVLLSIPIKLTSARFVALILNQKLRGIGIYRTIYYLPSLLGGSVAMSVTWKMVLSRTGFMNQFLGFFGLGPYSFLSSPDTALATLAMITAWQFGSSMIIFLSGLKGIPENLYEAARIDGAKKHQQLLHITIPMLGPSLSFNLIMGIIGSFQVFSLAYVTTEGGPVKSTYFYVLYLYNYAFSRFKMGYASALAWILTILIVVCTALAYKITDRHIYYET